MPRQRPPVKDIMRITGLSRASVDRALNAREGVRPTTLAAVEAAMASLQAESMEAATPAPQSSKPKHFKFVIRADEEFTQSVIDQIQILSAKFAAMGCHFEVIPCIGRTTDWVAKTIGEQASADGVAILAENSFAVTSAASALKQKGLPVVATNTDIDFFARHSFVGIDNRGAGQSAGFMMGRHLCNQKSANVAVIVEKMLSVRCHEEREMGFRAVIRQRFPSINIIDVVRWDSSRSGTYESAKILLKEWQEIDGIYNTSGGNHGLAQALEEEGRLGRTLFIAHEVNPVTEPLVRADAIDYLITQNLKSLLMGTVEELLVISKGGQPSPIKMIRPELLCKYTLPLWVE